MIINKKITPGLEGNVPTGTLGLIAGSDNIFYIKRDDGSLIPISSGTSGSQTLQQTLNIGNTFSGFINVDVGTISGIIYGTVSFDENFQPPLGGLLLGSNIFGSSSNSISLINSANYVGSTSSFFVGGVIITDSIEDFGSSSISNTPGLINIMAGDLGSEEQNISFQIISPKIQFSQLEGSNNSYLRYSTTEGVWPGFIGNDLVGITSSSVFEILSTNFATSSGTSSYVNYTMNVADVRIFGSYLLDNDGTQSAGTLIFQNRDLIQFNSSGFVFSSNPDLKIESNEVTIGSSASLKNNDGNWYLKSNCEIEFVGSTDVNGSASVSYSSLDSNSLIFAFPQQYTTGSISVDKEVGVGFTIYNTSLGTVSVAYKIVSGPELP